MLTPQELKKLKKQAGIVDSINPLNEIFNYPEGTKKDPTPRSIAFEIATLVTRKIGAIGPGQGGFDPSDDDIQANLKNRGGHQDKIRAELSNVMSEVHKELEQMIENV